MIKTIFWYLFRYFDLTNICELVDSQYYNFQLLVSNDSIIDTSWEVLGNETFK